MHGSSLVLALIVLGLLFVRVPDLRASWQVNCIRLSSLVSSAARVLCTCAMLESSGAPHPRVDWARGWRYLYEGRLEEAEPLLRHAHDAMPANSVVTYHWRAAFLGATGRFGELPSLPGGLDTTQEGDLPWLSRARQLAAAGDWLAAQEAYVRTTGTLLESSIALPVWFVHEIGWVRVRKLQADLLVDPASVDLRYRLGRAYARLQKWQDALVEYRAAYKERATLTPEMQADLQVDIGVAYTALEDWPTALTWLSGAYGAGERRPGLMLALIHALQADGQLPQAAQVEAELKQAGPRYPVDMPTTDGWQLWGYDLDERELEEGPQVTLFLFYRHDQADCTQCAVVVSHRATNLAFDGSFEWTPASPQPASDRFLNLKESCAPLIGRDPQATSHNQVLLAQGSSQNPSSTNNGCYSYPARISSDQLYLLRGMIATQGQVLVAFMVNWLWSGPRSSDYDVRAGAVVQPWSERHTLTRPPTEAKRVVVRMMQYDVGWVAYDNVLLAAIPSKPSVGP
ncbi:MAG: hypothetical protein FJ026_14915 [Chloroflexi bacterium]|nr:hypothetical protein [Chloroflexota bacterium]